MRSISSGIPHSLTHEGPPDLSTWPLEDLVGGLAVVLRVYDQAALRVDNAAGALALVLAHELLVELAERPDRNFPDVSRASRWLWFRDRARAYELGGDA